MPYIRFVQTSAPMADPATGRVLGYEKGDYCPVTHEDFIVLPESDSDDSVILGNALYFMPCRHVFHDTGATLRGMKTCPICRGYIDGFATVGNPYVSRNDFRHQCGEIFDAIVTQRSELQDALAIIKAESKEKMEGIARIMHARKTDFFGALASTLDSGADVARALQSFSEMMLDFAHALRHIYLAGSVQNLISDECILALAVMLGERIPGQATNVYDTDYIVWHTWYYRIQDPICQRIAAESYPDLGLCKRELDQVDFRALMGDLRRRVAAVSFNYRAPELPAYISAVDIADSVSNVYAWCLMYAFYDHVKDCIEKIFDPDPDMYAGDYEPEAPTSPEVITQLHQIRDEVVKKMRDLRYTTSLRWYQIISDKQCSALTKDYWERLSSIEFNCDDATNTLHFHMYESRFGMYLD